MPECFNCGSLGISHRRKWGNHTESGCCVRGGVGADGRSGRVRRQQPSKSESDPIAAHRRQPVLSEHRESNGSIIKGHPDMFTRIPYQGAVAVASIGVDSGDGAGLTRSVGLFVPD